MGGLPVIKTVLGNMKSLLMRTPTHISALAALRRERWEESLPWQVHDPRSDIWFNKRNCGRVREFSPFYFADQENIAKLSAMLAGNWPRMTAMQFICHGSDNIDPIIDRWLGGITTPNPLLRGMARTQAEFFMRSRRGIREMGGTPVRNMRHFWTCYFPTAGLKDRFNPPKEWLELMEGAEKGLSGARMNPRSQSPADFVDWWSRFYNQRIHLPRLPYDGAKTIDEQIIKADTPIDEHSDHLKVGDKYVYVLAPKAMPTVPHPFETRQLIGGSGGPADDCLQLRCPFIWTTLIVFDTDGIKGDVKGNLNIASSQQFAGALLQEQVARYRDLDAVQKDIVKQVPQVWVLPILVLYGDDRGVVESAVSTAKSSIWSRAGFELAVENDMKKALFLAAQPFGFEAAPENISAISRMNVANAPAALTISPIQGAYRGVGREAQELYTERNGQMVTQDPWALTSYSTMTIAPTGKGKSVNLNYRSFNSLLREEKVIVFEMGESLAALCHLAKGRHVTFDRNPRNVTCMNMFQMFGGDRNSAEDVAGNYMQWATVVYNMAFAQSAKPPTDNELAVFIEAVKTVYERNGEDSHIGHVADFLRGFQDQSAFLQDNKAMLKDRLVEFAHQSAYVLTQYGWVPGGQYSRWVNGKSTLDIAGYPMTLFEVKDLGDKALFNVITLNLMSATQNVVWKYPEEMRKRIAIDESPVFLAGIVSLAAYLKEWYRQIRKRNGGVDLIAQGFTDIEEFSDGILSVILNNSERINTLGMGEDQVNAGIRLGIISEASKELLLSMDSPENLYSEIAVTLKKGGVGIQRLLLAKYLLASFTTHKDDRPRINAIREQMFRTLKAGEFMEGYNMAAPEKEEDFKALIYDLAIRQFVGEKWGPDAI